MRSLRRWLLAVFVGAVLLALPWGAVRHPDTVLDAAAAQAGVKQTVSGDLNGDGQRDISDALHLLDFLFAGGPAPAPCSVVEESVAPTTIVLLRHAEKDVGVDPELTDVGHQRALRLSEVLAGTDYDLLVSSDLIRTVQSLEPLAARLAQDIEAIRDIDDVVARLDGLAPGDRAVVAHHSFTIRGILAGLEVSEEDLATVRILGNDQLWIVTRAPGRTVTMTSLRYATDL